MTEPSSIIEQLQGASARNELAVTIPMSQVRLIIKALDESWSTLPSCGSLFGDGRDAQAAFRALGYSWEDDE